MSDLSLHDTVKIDKRMAFRAKGLKEYYERERQRTESILEQSNRLQMFQALLTAAYYAAVPSLLDYLKEIENNLSIIWVLSSILTIIMCFSLGFTLLVQRRNNYGVPPRLDKEKGKKYLISGKSIEELEIIYTNETYPAAIDVLETRNNRKVIMLKTATILLAVDVVLIAIMAIGFAVYLL